MHKNRSLGLYIHIPFCLRKCNYCDFYSFKSDEKQKERYVAAIIKNVQKSAELFSDSCIDSVFFGGGTPTCLSAAQLDMILNSIYKRYSVAQNAEITTECNPATADYDCLCALRQGGFNRLSLGMQSANDNELKALGRLHSFADFERTYTNAVRAGFYNIGVDIMFGIPEQTEESFEHTLSSVLKYSPTHISAYSLILEPGTPLFKNKAKLILPNEDAEYNMYKRADAVLSSLGYDHYEISNYAREGYRSRHNLKYWNCEDYIGIGVSAHSCIKQNRYSIVSDFEEYVTASINDNLNSVCVLEEALSPEEFAEEYIMMKMRLRSGLSSREYLDKFSREIDQKYIDKMSPFIKSGHIINKEDRFFFSIDGMYISNYILSEILDLK